MLLRSTFHPCADGINKHLCHLHPSQVKGLALWLTRRPGVPVPAQYGG